MLLVATGLLSLFSKGHSPFSLLEYMNHSSFDELISVDLNADRYKFIFNVEEKYLVPTTEGRYSLFYDYIVKNILHPDDREVYAGVMDPATISARLKAAEIPGALDLQYRIRNLEGGWRWVEQFVLGGPAHSMPENTFCCYIFDIQNMKDREEGKTRVRHRHTASHDRLTGLLQDKDFYAACEVNLSNTKINWLLAAIDLQHFKLFNEWYGRRAGDRVLANIGRELDAIAEARNGVAGYMGGDDFALLVPAESFDARALFDRIHAVVTSHGASVGFQPAIGTCCSLGNISIYTLYDQASIACQEAKSDFKNSVMAYDPSMVERTVEDYRILSDFKDALRSGEITFYLQPQCRSLNGRIVGAEALARWIKPDGRRVPPISFIPVLEKYGFIPDLDKHIWDKVCQWIRRTRDRGLPLIPVSVNISPVDIFSMDVPAYFEALVERYDIPRSAIKVEITESAYGEDSDRVRSTVQAFRERGFLVLMDDFGSGFSSLNMLRELNVDVIKLDAQFLRMEQANEKKGMQILESVVNMAKTMDMPIIVEGVETEEQNVYLMSLGCRYIQGYYFYRPMTTSEFEGLLAQREKIDERGFVTKANDEFRIREFLNDTVYSDSMLNNIIGPAAIYAWHGEDIDIVRFNQQFYQAVNVPDFADRLLRIQQFMPESEVPLLRRLLQKAYEDHLNGSCGVMTFGKVDGTYAKFMIRFFFLNEDGKAKRFYGAARDITDITNLHSHMALLARFTSKTVVFLLYKGGQYSFEVVAHGLEDAMGLTRQQLECEINGETFYRRLIPMDESVLWKIAHRCMTDKETRSAAFKMEGADGELGIAIDADYVDDISSDVKCILSMRRIR